MAVTPGLVGSNQTVGASEEQILIAPSGNAQISTLCIRNRVDSPVPIIVRIPELHGTTPGAGALVNVGEKELFRVKDGLLRECYVSGNTAKIDWYGVAQTLQ